jgi:hypothetical protein
MMIETALCFRRADVINSVGFDLVTWNGIRPPGLAEPVRQPAIARQDGDPVNRLPTGVSVETTRRG